MYSTIMTSKPGHDSAQVDGTEGRIFIDPLELDSDHITMETHEGRQIIPVPLLARPLFDQPRIEDFARRCHRGHWAVSRSRCAVKGISYRCTAYGAKES